MCSRETDSRSKAEGGRTGARSSAEDVIASVFAASTHYSSFKTRAGLARFFRYTKACSNRFRNCAFEPAPDFVPTLQIQPLTNLNVSSLVVGYTTNWISAGPPDLADDEFQHIGVSGAQIPHSHALYRSLEEPRMQRPT